MPALTKVHSFVEAVGQKKHNLHADTLKWMLTNVAPTTASAVKADITEIAPGNGYAAGGAQQPNNTFTQAAGLAKLLGDTTVITASGGPIGPFRYAVLYNDTALNDEVIGFADYGQAITLQAGESINIKNVAANGILQLQ